MSPRIETASVLLFIKKNVHDHNDGILKQRINKNPAERNDMYVSMSMRRCLFRQQQHMHTPTRTDTYYRANGTPRNEIQKKYRHNSSLFCFRECIAVRSV